MLSHPILQLDEGSPKKSLQIRIPKQHMQVSSCHLDKNKKDNIFMPQFKQLTEIIKEYFLYTIYVN